MTLIVVCSPTYGDTFAVVRASSSRGVFVEMVYIPPIGTELRVHFGETPEERFESLMRVSSFAQNGMHRMVFLEFVAAIATGLEEQAVQH